MITKPTLAILCFLLLTGCNNNHAHTPQNKDTGITKTQPASSSSDTITNTISGTDEDAFARYDQAKKLLAAWNDAINKVRPDQLKAVYADTVRYYRQSFSKEACIAQKIEWLQKHEGYTQKMKNVSVYYLDADTSMSVIIAAFDKICLHQQSTATVHSFLYFARLGNDWKIIGESDEATELNRARKAPNSMLKNGEQVFYYGYWEDTRNIDGFAHNMVPYNSTLTLHVADKITGYYTLYSGALRSTTSYLIPTGKIENGILLLTAVYNGNDEFSLEDYEHGEIPDKKKEQWHFKIINGNELVCLDKNNGYLYGRSLFLNTSP